MSISFKPLRAVLLGVAVLAASLVAGVGAASAAPVPAYWSVSGSTAMQGSLTLTRGAQTATCPAFRLVVTTGTTGFMGGTQLNNCSGSGLSGTFPMFPYGTAWLDSGAYKLRFEGTSGWGAASLLGNFTPAQFTWVPFANGSASTPSKLTFANTYIGSAGNGPVFATGVLNVATNPGGGLVKLN